MATIYLYPNGNLSPAELLLLGADSGYEAIDDVQGSPDDDSSYIYAPFDIASAWAYSHFSFENLTGTIKAINKVTIYMRGKAWESESSDYTAYSPVAYLLKDSNNSDSDKAISEVADSLSYITRSKEYSTNPFTSNAWTEDEVNDLCVAIGCYGYKSPEGVLITGRATQCYLKIDVTYYNDPTVTTTTPVTTKDHESATLEGEVTDADGQAITERGFEYKEGLEGEVSTVLEEDADFGEDTFSLEITGLKPYTEYYYRAYAVNGSGTGYGEWETFTTDKTTPTVSVSAPTDVLITSVTANGEITSSGGEDCSERGFEYGLTKTPTWSVKDDAGGYSAGEFSKGLSSLSANTYYWIRAYAVNSIGTGYSEWIQFQTAAEGAIPTGTKINICSDYSGYTYKVMRSETDDGEEYTAYFVISTDLTNKQGLAYYKRILDMDLYFNNEDSGTATISVKRDNETSWVSLGSVSLAGNDDIIIKHLAVDVRAKHFLFKISASNHFEFLGVLFQFIPIGMR